MSRPTGPPRTLVVDLHGVADRDGMMAAFARDLAVPAGFGANWDALADVLRDLAWLPASGYVVDVRGGETLARLDPRSWSILAEVAEEAVAFWTAEGRSFVVRGEPPFSAS